MTKAALKRRTARLIEKRDRMNELIEGNEQEITELDSLESRQLLEKFNIESEELAKLIYMRDRANKAAADRETPVKQKTAARTVVSSEPAEDKAPEADTAPETYDPLHISRAGKEEEQ